MDQDALHSGLPLWRAIGPAPLQCAKFASDQRCEVAVIGGGITGALVGYYLAKAGVDCVVLDREQIGAGSTAASTGLLQYEIDTPLVELIQKVGEAHAVQAYRRGLKAVDELESLIATLEHPCGFARRQTICLASHAGDVSDLRREFECRRDFGFHVQYLEPGPLQETFGLRAPAALLSTGDGELDPYCFTQALFQAGRSQGLELYDQTTVSKIDESPLGVQLATNHATLSARSAIVCTGYAAGELLGTSPGTLSTTYAAASEPAAAWNGWPAGCLLWETARPYFYARQAADGRLIVGGEDTPGPFDHEHDGLLQKKSQALAARLTQLFPDIQMTPACSWAGTFAETSDGLPYIGKLPGRENVYAALGYGGNGITFGMIAARLLADLILQRPNDDAAVFAFGR